MNVWVCPLARSPTCRRILRSGIAHRHNAAHEHHTEPPPPPDQRPGPTPPAPPAPSPQRSPSYPTLPPPLSPLVSPLVSRSRSRSPAFPQTPPPRHIVSPEPVSRSATRSHEPRRWGGETRRNGRTLRAQASATRSLWAGYATLLPAAWTVGSRPRRSSRGVTGRWMSGTAETEPSDYVAAFGGGGFGCL